jgi:hypothetical protein
MRRTFGSRCISALAVVIGTGLCLALASGAGAGRAATGVSGTYSVADLGTPTCAPVGVGGFILNCTITGFVSDYVGSLEGTTVTNFTQQINCKTGRTHGNGIETFTGSVVGLGSGTLTWRDVFDADFDCTTFTETNLAILGASVSGGDGLAGVQGKITFTDTSYEGVLH